MIGLVTGGARSGKSRFALETAARLSDGRAITFIATAEARDEEMRDRIARHRSERSEDWQTLEAPLDVPSTLARATHDLVIVDCMTLLLSNHLLRESEEPDFQAEELGESLARQVAEAAAHSGRHVIFVTNEVGLGVVPPTPLGPAFRDAQGRLNQVLAAEADWVVMAVSGIPTVLKGTVP